MWLVFQAYRFVLDKLIIFNGRSNVSSQRIFKSFLYFLVILLGGLGFQISNCSGKGKKGLLSSIRMK